MGWRLESDNPGGFATGRRFSCDAPCPAVMAAGMGGDSLGHWWIVSDGLPEAPRPAAPAKPPYRVPSMAEVRATPRNGLKVASTFSGCGGSCLGYRMAGFEVVWANEFVPAARQSYLANCDHGCVLDGRDVREVKASEVLEATGLKEGELDLFDGSPPCQAFSTAGKRSKGWGKDRVYEHGAAQRNEELFFEYIRLLRGLRPRAFVAENVAGLVRGVAKGFFLEILRGLRECGYRVEARLLDAQWLGVPQTRARVIFIGVREDLGLAPAFPSPLPWFYSVRDALPWIDDATAVAGSFERFHDKRDVTDAPCPAVLSGQPWHYQVEGDGPPRPGQTVARRKFTIAELRRICAFPDDFVLTGSYAQQWERLGNSVPPVMMRHVAEAVRDRVLLPARGAGR